jgi:hypothetical protein
MIHGFFPCDEIPGRAAGCGPEELWCFDLLGSPLACSEGKSEAGLRVACVCMETNTYVFSAGNVTLTLYCFLYLFINCINFQKKSTASVLTARAEFGHAYCGGLEHWRQKWHHGVASAVPASNPSPPSWTDFFQYKPNKW